jgi:hypothetical protein
MRSAGVVAISMLNMLDCVLLELWDRLLLPMEIA